MAHAFVSWALCTASMVIGMSVTSVQNAIIIHAIAVPIISATVSWVYFSRFAYTTPIRTAIVFTSFVIVVDFFVAALLVQRSLEMFASPLGTWIPFALIFTSTYLTTGAQVWFAPPTHVEPRAHDHVEKVAVGLQFLYAPGPAEVDNRAFREFENPIKCLVVFLDVKVDPILGIEPSLESLRLFLNSCRAALLNISFPPRWRSGLAAASNKLSDTLQ